MKVTVYNPAGMVCSGDVDALMFSSKTGDIQILPLHAPLYTNSDYGIVQINQDKILFVDAVLEVKVDVSIFCMFAAKISDLSEDGVRNALAGADGGVADDRKAAFIQSLLDLPAALRSK